MCYQQSLSLKHSNLPLKDSEFPASAMSFNSSQKSPFTNQTSSSSPPLPSFQTFCTTLSTSSLLNNRSSRIPNLANNLNFSPINIQLSINDKFQHREYLRKPAISSPRFYKLNTRSIGGKNSL
jgi:hypothetical protein